MMPPMRTPATPELTSRTNPRVAAVAALRDRRERDAARPHDRRRRPRGPSGARRRRRGRRGVRLRAAAGRAGRARGPRRSWQRPGIAPVTTSAAVFEKLAFGDRSEGLVAVVRIPDLSLERLALPADAARRSSSRASRSRATSARSCARPTAPGSTRVIAASPRTDLFNPNAIRASAGTIFSVPLAAAPSDDVRPWLREQRPPGRRRARRCGAVVHGGRPARSARDRRRGRGDRPRRGLARPGRRAGRHPDARRRRQPERVGQRGGVALRGPTATPTSCRTGRLSAMDPFDFVDHRRRPGRRGGGLQGARARRLGRDRRSPLVRRQLSAHRLHPVQVAAPRRRPPRSEPGRVPVVAGIVATRLHDQPCRPTRTSPTTRATSGRSRRPAPSSTAGPRGSPAAGWSRSATTTPRTKSRARERRRRGRVRLEDPAARGHRGRPRLDEPRGDARPRVAGAACSSSVAARPAASWPRSTLASRSRRRSSSPGRVSPRPTIRATPRRSGRPWSRTGSRSDSACGRCGRTRAPGPDGQHVVDLDDGSTAQGHVILRGGRPGRSRSTTSVSSTTASIRGRATVPARRPAAHRRRPVRDRRPGRPGAPHPPGPLPGRARGADGPRRGRAAGLPRPAARDVHGSGGRLGRPDPRRGARRTGTTPSSWSPTSRGARRATRSRRASGT